MAAMKLSKVVEFLTEFKSSHGDIAIEGFTVSPGYIGFDQPACPIKLKGCKRMDNLRQYTELNPPKL